MKWMFLAGALLAGAAHADCTLVADATSGKTLLEEGQCDLRTTPMSTFKIAISLMGFDSGVLKDEHAPVLPFKKGYIDWREEWKKDTDPAAWMKLSVIWYSQQTAHRLGLQQFRKYISDFGYGNRDASRKDALDKAWLESSLQISGREQVAFLTRLVQHQLPVSDHAYAMTEAITDAGTLPGSWSLHGKTGSGSVGKEGLGWYVGWARRGGQTIVFAHQILEKEDLPGPSGYRARDAMVKRLPAILPPQ